MTYSQKGGCGYNSNKDESGEPQFEYQVSTMNPILEPVTPPAASHPGSLYSNQYFLPHHNPMSSKSQQSPGLATRDLSGASYGYNASVPMMLASPVDTPLAMPFNAKQQQQQVQNSSQQTYLSAPHTPLSTSSLDGGSIPSTPSTSRPLSMTSGRHSASTTNTSPFPGIGPLGHSRSYSYNIRDQHQSLNRISMGTPMNTATSGQDRQFRPRAYSSGLAGAPVKNTASSGYNHVEKPGNEQPVTSSAFPPPLSSPISPENLVATNIRVNQRPHYAHNLTPSTDEVHYRHSRSGSQSSGLDQVPRRELTRSLSAVSSLASSSLSHQNVSLGQISQRYPNEDFTDSHLFTNPLATPAIASNRRASPPAGRDQRQRRSSSGASSMSTINLAFAPIDDLSHGSDFVAKPSSFNFDIAVANDQEVHSLCKDQRGCRFLQRKLSDGDPSVIRKIFNATHPHVVSLMMDPFGNYLCQKLFEYCTADEITQLLMAASPSLPTVAVNQHGTRALQKLIDAVTQQDQVAILISALDGHVVRLIRDLNGNHVIQKLLLDLDATGSQFIYVAVCHSIVKIGSHRHGCCVLQRCLDYAQGQNRNNLVAHIVAKALVLVCDPFGNYVCQYVIDLGIQEYTDSLVTQLLGKLSSLSVQKFSSNVVEKCLRAASFSLQKAMIAEIMTPKTLNELLLDNYGNYVIQTALEASSSLDATTKHQLSMSIQTALTTTRSPYGRRVMSKLKSW